MEYYSALKKSRKLTHATSWMTFEDVKLNNEI